MTIRICRGCDDLHACPGGCSWVLLDVATPTGICNVCAEEWNWHPVMLAQHLSDEAARVLGLA